MKQTLRYTILFCFFTALSSAQDYIPLLGNTTWNLVVAGFGGSQETSLVPSGNVTVGGNIYIQYNDVPLAGDVLVREDVAMRRVYKRINNSDELLYDFSLQVNDVVVIGNNTYTVTARDSMTVMTGRKRVRLDVSGQNSGGFEFNETWIEGVGSWKHPFAHFPDLPSDPATYVKCSFNDGQAAFNLGLMNTGNPYPCDPPTAGVDDVTLARGINIYPNPIRGNGLIRSDKYLQNAELTLYNSFGQEVKALTKQSGTEISLWRDGLANGLYFLKLTESGREIFSSKIVIAD